MSWSLINSIFPCTLTNIVIIRLLKAAEEVLVPGSTAYIDIVTTIENEHVAHATEALERSNASTTLINDTIRDIRLECGKLRSFLEAAEVIEEVSPRSRDMVISYGEKLSCRIFTSILKARVGIVIIIEYHERVNIAYTSTRLKLLIGPRCCVCQFRKSH